MNQPLDHGRRRAAFAIAAACAAVALPARAQGYPDRTMKMVVPFPPGGGFDAIARPFAEKLSAVLGQAIVIDNHAGAGGNIGTEFVARSTADGYTLLFANDYLGTNPNLYRKLGYQPLKDFVPISEVGFTAMAVSVFPGIPAKNMQELIALSQKRTLNYGTPGIGTSPHLFAEQMAFTSGMKVNHVPYRGTGPAIADALGGQIDMVVTPLTAVVQQVRAGKLRGIGIGLPQRSPLMPEVPTLAESGVQDVHHDIWYGLFAPTGTPDAVLARLREATRAVLAQPELAKLLRDLGYEPRASSPGALTDQLTSDLAKWHAVVERAHISVD